MGKHVICSIYGVSFSKLDDLNKIKQEFDKAVALMGANVLHKFSHQFVPQGVTVLYALSESHISCHTFPEKGGAALDCYTCGDVDPEVGMRSLLEFFNPVEISMQVIAR